MNKIVSKLLLLIFLGCGVNITAQEEAPSLIRVGIYHNPPKVFINEQGKADGIFIDILDCILKDENLQVKYVPGRWEELTEMLSRGKIDVLPDVAFSKERDSLFTFNSLPVLNSWLEAYTRKDNRIYTLAGLENKKIGVLNGSVQEDFFRGYIKENLDLNYEIKAYPGYPQSVRALKSGEIEVLIASRFFYFSKFSEKMISPTGIIFRPSELYFAFPKQVNPVLTEIFDRKLAQLKNDPHSEYYGILHSWFDPVLRTGIPPYVLWLLVTIIILLLIIIAFTLLLRYQVKLKTRALWQKNRQLTLAKEKAEENERLKTIFLQNMSHEIRTPMNGIIGFLNLLKEPDLDSDSRQKYIDIVNKSGKRLLATINNIIEISKIDSRQIAVHYSEVDIFEVTDFYFHFFHQQAEEKKLQLKLSVNLGEEDSPVITDKFILDNILTNLLNNAIKFTTKGFIEFGVYREEEMLVFYVKDTGVGIPEERQEAIFERFVQANLNITRPHEGSGLGLAIVKAYVEVLKGKLWLESHPGKGTTFFFSIPFIPAKKEDFPIDSDKEMPEVSGEKIKMLIAEDDNISYLFIQQLLNKPEITLLRAKDGKQVIDLAKENPDLSLILMDIKMPVLNGIDATKKIREFNPLVPIIAQSAYSSPGDQEKAFEAGCNDYITKPISKKRLLSLIHKFSGSFI